MSVRTLIIVTFLPSALRQGIRAICSIAAGPGTVVARRNCATAATNTPPHRRDTGGEGRVGQAAMTRLFSTVVTPAAAQARRSTRRRWVDDPTVPLNVRVWS